MQETFLKEAATIVQQHPTKADRVHHPLWNRLLTREMAMMAEEDSAMGSSSKHCWMIDRHCQLRSHQHSKAAHVRQLKQLVPALETESIAASVARKRAHLVSTMAEAR